MSSPHYRNCSGRNLRPRIYHNPPTMPKQPPPTNKKASTVPHKHPHQPPRNLHRASQTPPSLILDQIPLLHNTFLHNVTHLHDASSQNYSPTMAITTSPYTQHQYHTHSTSTSHHSPPWYSVATYETSLYTIAHVPTTP